MHVGGGSYSEVYLFSPKDTTARAQFVTITTPHATLTLTPGHYVPLVVDQRPLLEGDESLRGDESKQATDGLLTAIYGSISSSSECDELVDGLRTRLVPARSVLAGDRLLLADGSSATVSAIGGTWSTGLVNPLTKAGRIVVDGVVASCVHPRPITRARFAARALNIALRPPHAQPHAHVHPQPMFQVLYGGRAPFARPGSTRACARDLRVLWRKCGCQCLRTRAEESSVEVASRCDHPRHARP